VNPIYQRCYVGLLSLSRILGKKFGGTLFSPFLLSLSLSLFLASRPTTIYMAQEPINHQQHLHDLQKTTTTPTRYMAQEPINYHQHQHDPPKPPLPREAGDDHRIQERESPPPTQNQRLQLQLSGDGHHNHQQEVAGTSGSSSNNGGGGVC
jgi:hypothetical protein